MESRQPLSPDTAFTAHFHLVLSVVAEFMRRVPRCVQREDLVAAGAAGLLRALRSDKHTCPQMLAAYARIVIRGAVIDELRRQDWAPRRRRPASTVLPPVVVSTPAAGGSDPTSNSATREVVVIGFDDLPPAHEVAGDGLSPLEALEFRRMKSDIRGAVARLPARERSIVEMRYFDELPGKAIAASMGVSEARVSQLLTRATSHLKALLEDANELERAA